MCGPKLDSHSEKNGCLFSATVTPSLSATGVTKRFLISTDLLNINPGPNITLATITVIIKEISGRGNLPIFVFSILFPMSVLNKARSIIDNAKTKMQIPVNAEATNPKTVYLSEKPIARPNEITSHNPKIIILCLFNCPKINAISVARPIEAKI